MKKTKNIKPKLHTKKIRVPWENFIWCPHPVAGVQFQKQFDDVQSMVADMILLGKGIRLKEELNSPNKNEQIKNE